MTNDEQELSPDPRFKAWIGATVVLFLVAVVVGFVWLPSAQGGPGELGLWGAICRAVGLPTGRVQLPAIAGARPASTIAWTPATRNLLGQGDAARGATLATTCNNCHGVNGVSADAIFPNLVGQSVAAIYKQLTDFKSKKRNATVMGVFASPLSERDMLDIAAHFASLPSPFTADGSATDAAARHLVEVGSPLRGIAPCAACHGPAGRAPGAPGLAGQQRAYLEQELQAFASGARRNDINEQMRSVARQLTGNEIALLAAHYSSVPGAIGR